MSRDAPKANASAPATNGTQKLRVLALKDGHYGSGKLTWRAGHEYWMYKGPNGTKYLCEDVKEPHNFKRGIGLLYTWDPGVALKGLFRVIENVE